MPSFLLLVAVCAGAATLGANNLETSVGSAAGYLAVSAASGVAMVLRFKAALRADLV
jgi:hypothetical protein